MDPELQGKKLFYYIFTTTEPSRKILYHKKKEKPFIGTYLLTGTVNGKKRESIKGDLNLF